MSRSKLCLCRTRRAVALGALGAAALLLSGCSSLNPDIRAVKDTVIEENHAFFTVGRVLDFYPDCLDTRWDAYKDPKGHRWVHYACSSKSACDFRDSVLEELKGERAEGDAYRGRAERALNFTEGDLVLTFRLLGESEAWKLASTRFEFTWPDGRTAQVTLPAYAVIAAMKKGEPVRPEEMGEEPGLVKRLWSGFVRSAAIRFMMHAYDNAALPERK